MCWSDDFLKMLNERLREALHRMDPLTGDRLLASAAEFGHATQNPRVGFCWQRLIVSCISPACFSGCPVPFSYFATYYRGQFGMQLSHKWSLGRRMGSHLPIDTIPALPPQRLLRLYQRDPKTRKNSSHADSPCTNWFSLLPLQQKSCSEVSPVPFSFAVSVPPWQYIKNLNDKKYSHIDYLGTLPSKTCANAGDCYMNWKHLVAW